MNPVNLTYVPKKEKDRQFRGFMENFSLNILQSKPELPDFSDLYTEAVFINGREKVKPVADAVQRIKNLLDSKIAEADALYKSDVVERTDPKKLFNSVAFWRDQVFKDFEDRVRETFGFRSVELAPYTDLYDATDRKFKYPDNRGGYTEADMADVGITYGLRYPIDGIVTDDGFYDKTHSITMSVRFSLTFLHAMNVDEIMAVFLHEFGHSIDPAIVDIRYTEVNILSKYLTDRQGALTVGEKKYIAKNKFEEFAVMGILVGIWAIGSLVFKIINFFKRKKKDSDQKRRAPDEIEKKIKSIRKTIQKSPTFNRQNYGEAFADNFARMYGYGSAVISSLHKMKVDDAKTLRSRIQKEADRQRIILDIVEAALKGVHKTNIHRIRSLLREYEVDLADPKIKEDVKKAIREDKEELEKLLDQYLNNFSEFQNRINRIINEELIKIENKAKETPEPLEKPEEIIPTDTEGAIEAMRGRGHSPVTQP